MNYKALFLILHAKAIQNRKKIKGKQEKKDHILELEYSSFFPDMFPDLNALLGTISFTKSYYSHLIKQMILVLKFSVLELNAWIFNPDVLLT